MIILIKIMKVIKIFIITLIFSLNFSFSSYANQSVEEIIKGRKAIFDSRKNQENLKNCKINGQDSILKRISEQ